MMNIENKKVLVVGLGKSGEAAAELLLNKGGRVFITEREENNQLRDLANSFVKKGALVELGGHSLHFIKKAELIVISPGVSPESDVVKWANEYKVPIVSELEFASWYISCPIIAVTGTNGKSTVTSLIEHIFRKNDRNVIACGNIGLPLSEVALKYEKLDFAIVEVSSFQLENIRDFRPDVAVWLNFSYDHLDYHRTMERYLAAKLNIFRNQKSSDWVVINSKELDRVGGRIRAKMKTWEGNDDSAVFSENIQAAAAVAGIYGITPRDIQSAVGTFKPLPHRFEYVTTIDGIDFIDDSKATNVASVIAALRNLKGPVVLILGGRDKGDDFTRLKELIRKKVSSIIVIGEAQDKICSQLIDTVPLERAVGFNNAVKHAFGAAAFGAAVLFSPGCSSFDMFKDYKERGDEFKKCVAGLGAKKEACLVEE